MTVTDETSDYNQAAIATAARLFELRSDEARKEQRAEAPLERLLRPHDLTAAGVAREWTQMGERHVSAELESRAEALGASFEHLAVTLGTVIHGVDLRDPSDELIGFIRATLLERKVVFFRDQHLSEDEQVAFGRCFGGLDAFPFGKPGENPYILEIVHGPGSPGYENGWHTDVTWMEQPSLGSIAQLIVKPPVGGDTLFSDSHAVYQGLPTDLRERIEHLSGINDYQTFIAGYGGKQLPDEVVDAIKADIPFGVPHPLVRTHPETGKRALYLHGGFLRHDSLFDDRTGEQLDADESRAIVAQLLKHHARPEYICRFSWEVGSIAFWDNRAVQHYAASDYYPHKRLLRRVTVSGDRPYREPVA